MKNRNILLTLAVVAVLVLSSVLIASAVTEDEIKPAIDKGVAWLVTLQNPDGSWGDGWNQIARTGFAVVKLEDRAIELGFKSPFDPAYQYAGNVEKGLNYIFTNAQTTGIAVQPAGNPDTNGNGTGVYFGWQRTYETGIAMMAIAASRDPARLVATGPLTGKAYKDVLQDAVDYFAFGQNDYPTGQGGWGYEENVQGQEWVCEPKEPVIGEPVEPQPNASICQPVEPPVWHSRSDNSNSGYAVLGLRYAESYGFACTVPQFVKDELKIWIDYIQDDVSGGSGYSDPSGWVNLLKTGNLLFEMAFVGDNVDTQRVKDAIAYIQNHWNDANWDPGWKGPGWRDGPHYQATYSLMKGFESLGIKTIKVGTTDVDWFDEMSTAIVGTQNADGSWPQDQWGDQILATEWALLTLERVAPPVPLTAGKVSGGGQIEIKLPGAPPGQAKGKETGKASFGFIVMYNEGEPAPKGELQYVDHTTQMNAHCHDMTGLFVSSDKTKATFEGMCTINGANGFVFTAYVEDNGEPGKNDVFKIKLSNGYSSDSTLLNGNIQIHKKP